MPLTDTQIRALKPLLTPAKHSDGGGLHLLVSPRGSKLWRLAYRYEGKQKTLALGTYPVISLFDARQKRESAKKLLASGVDPAQQAKLDKIAKRALNANTFALVADEFLSKVRREGKAEATMTKKRWSWRPVCRSPRPP
jgi:hypothetical protein